MPLVDMPLEQLKQYRGTNPRPADFDAYWDASLAELDTLDPKVELIPASFQAPGAECYDLYFTGVRGARVYAKFLKPTNVKGKMPAALFFHGYTGMSEPWIKCLSYCLAGFATFYLDVRGQGGKSEDVGGVKGTTQSGHIIRGLEDSDPTRLLFRDIFLDTAEIARIAMSMPFIDPARVCAIGGSQGGGLTLACAALEPRVAKAFPIYPFLSDYKRVWDMDLDVAAYAELRYFFRMFDPSHEKEGFYFTKLGYIDIHHLAPRIRADVSMFTGLMDSVVPPSTQFAAYNAMVCKKKVTLYPDYGHEFIPPVDDIIFGEMCELL